MKKGKGRQADRVFPLYLGLSQIPHPRSELEITFIGVYFDHH